MAMKYTNLSIPSSSKIFPNWDFWYEDIPSGNPDSNMASQDFFFGQQTANPNVDVDWKIGRRQRPLRTFMYISFTLMQIGDRM
jgi:hypothetical protein